MQEAIKCLFVENGLICLVYADYTKELENLKEKDISISIFDEGIAVVLKKELVIPIPEGVLDYFIDNPNITVYPFSPANYVEKYIVTVSLSRDAIFEARTIFKYSRKSEKVQ